MPDAGDRAAGWLGQMGARMPNEVDPGHHRRGPRNINAAERDYHQVGRTASSSTDSDGRPQVARTPTVADIVNHYLHHHRQGRTLDDIAEKLKELTERGSDTSISAWAKGWRVPAGKQVKELRKILGCHCFEFGDEAIGHAYITVAAARATKRDGRSRSRPWPTAADRLNPIHNAVPAARIRPPRKHVVGREGEVRDFADLRAGRSAHRLINIFGPGGIGKTEVFHMFVRFGELHLGVLGYADVAEIRYGGLVQSFTAAEILRGLAATIDRSEMEPFRRDLRDFDLGTAAMRAAGGVGGFFAPGGRPVDEVYVPHAAEGASPRLLDAMNSRYGFERYLRQAPAMLTGAFCDGLNAVAEDGNATILMLDTYEEIAELDDWICRDLVPLLPDHARLVMLGRRELTKTNVDWLDHQDVLQARPLPELSEDEAKSYLRYYGLTDTAALQGVYAVTGGYPLLLVLARALAVESGGWETIGELEWDRDRDRIANRLLERILREERVRNIREVLETCAIAPWIDPSIIAALLGVSSTDAHSAYTELSTHSFVTRHPRGVALHDKIRELLQVRLRFASDTRYNELTAALAAHLASKGGIADA
jgi:hypothetical protein